MLWPLPTPSPTLFQPAVTRQVFWLTVSLSTMPTLNSGKFTQGVANFTGNELIYTYGYHFSSSSPGTHKKSLGAAKEGRWWGVRVCPNCSVCQAPDPSGSMSPPLSQSRSSLCPPTVPTPDLYLTPVLFRSFTELQQGHSIHQLEAGGDEI